MKWIDIRDRKPKIEKNVDIVVYKFGKYKRLTNYSMSKGNDDRMYFDPNNGGICGIIVVDEAEESFEKDFCVVYWGNIPKLPKLIKDEK